MGIRISTRSIDVACLRADEASTDSPADRMIQARRAKWEQWREDRGLEDRRAAEIAAERAEYQ